MGIYLSGNLPVQAARRAEDDANCGASKGDPLPKVPRYSVSLSGDYDLTVTGFQPRIGATLRFVSDRVSTFSNVPSQSKLPAYAQVDLRAGATFGAVDVQAYVRNQSGRASCRERVCQYV